MSRNLRNELQTFFKGKYYRLPDNWINILDINNYANKPINYLEIGVYYGANLITTATTYAMHPDSKIFGIDPWEDYDDYPEYKGLQESTFNTFCENIKNSNLINRNIQIIRGYSHKENINFNDEFFDIIYIDGNHEPEYALEDAVLYFRKLKKDGVMIFDDYGKDEHGNTFHTEEGVDAFIQAYNKRIEILGIQDFQIFIKKKY